MAQGLLIAGSGQMAFAGQDSLVSSFEVGATEQTSTLPSEPLSGVSGNSWASSLERGVQCA